VNPDDVVVPDTVDGTPPGLISIPVDPCPRCQGVHLGATFRAFARSDDYTHWYTCPETLEPVLLRITAFELGQDAAS
jgi:hypothetical protein